MMHGQRNIKLTCRYFYDLS